MAATGYFYVPETAVALPTPPTPALRGAPLAAKPTVPRKLKKVTGNQSGELSDVLKASIAQASESQDCLVATGEVDSMRYGHVLVIRRTVGVRGAGRSFDGLYRVTAVTHSITRNKYTQQFTAKRDGLYSILPVLR